MSAPDTFYLHDRFSNADSLISENKIGDAMRVLEEIIIEDPCFGKAHNHMGWIFETKYRDYEKAEKHYKLCLQYEPGYAAAYYNYAVVLSTLQRFDELEILLNKALSIPQINRATINNEFGIMYEHQAKFDLAIDHYKKAILATLDNNNVNVYKDSINRCKTKKELIEH